MLRESSDVLLDLCSMIVKWFGNEVKGIVVNLKSSKIVVLIVLDGIDRISLVARGEISSFFLKKIMRSENFIKFVSKTGHEPDLTLLFLTEEELSFHIPGIVEILRGSYVLFGTDKIKKEVKFSNELPSSGRAVFFGKLKKGEVIDI